MEPERKIEKLLRAFAKKRRADAGDAFKLHPATRRLLQGEVARRAPKRSAAAESLWDWFRKRWVLRLGFALVVCVGAVLFLPALHRTKSNSNNTEAMSNAKPLGAAATIAAVDNSRKLPAPDVTGTISGQQSVIVASAGNLGGLQSNNLLAYAAKNQTDRATLFADNSAQPRRDEFSTITNRSQPALALAENAPSQKPNEAPAPVVVAAALTVAPPPVAGEPVVLAGTVNRVAAPPPGSVSGAVAATEGFASAASSRELRAAKTAPAQNATQFKSELAANVSQSATKNSQRFVQTRTKQIPPVLDSFELQQNGDRISVVDRDGSIYNGSLQPVDLVIQDDLSKAKEAADKTGVLQTAKKNLVVGGNAQSSAQNYYFRVSGANRSLKQNVVFAGNLIALTNVTANAAQNFSGGGGGGGGGQSKLADANVPQQQIFSNSRITGTVTIANTNQIEINAMPVNP